VGEERLHLKESGSFEVSRVAAIDCGTNSIRLLIADIYEGNFREIYRSMEIVRLGQGVDRNHRFEPEAIERTLSAVAKFGDEISRRGVTAIRFCATSATRDAENRDLFIDGVEALLGISPEVISGDEEARLSFAGATRQMHSSDSPYLVVDIGGGSTEFVFGDSEVRAAKSVDIGCVRISERHLQSQPPTKLQIAAALADIESAIDSVMQIVPIRDAETVVAVAGSATTVAAAALELEKYDRDAINLARISAAKVSEISERFLAMSRQDIAALAYMHPGRVDVIAAGALILARILNRAGATEFVASESDILDGMAWSIA
jgi:exopolyphosphatase/guanosine-5'-triphosphate,3'-diphosphate pyrophosphatase